MYESIINHPTKSYFHKVLYETMEIINNSEEKETTLYTNILEQLEDLKKNVIENRFITEWDEINERYTLGAIAIHEFQENDEMRNRLIEIFGGAVHYDELSD